VTVVVRRLAASELDAFGRDLPAWNSTEYAERLAAQERGELVQLVAWEDGRAVGKAMVLFPEHEEYSVSAERERCAEVRDVEVVETSRRRGIASAMIRCLEDAANERGMRRIGMSVAIGAGGGPAELVYGKLGYVRAHGPFITSTHLRGDDGRPLHVGAVMAYLVKDLV
jgi:GNAT superfamily N-acetyltransferase